MPEQWKSRVKADPTPWLLQAEPWTRLNTLTDLLDRKPDDPEVAEARNALYSHPLSQELMKQSLQWFPHSITSHNKANLSHYGFMTLGELGYTVDHPDMASLANKARGHLENDMYSIRQTLPEKGKGMGGVDPDAAEWHALPCDSPILTYTLLISGSRDSEALETAKILAERWSTTQGWFCHFFFVNGHFKNHNIGCPMAGLMALQVLSQIDNLKESQAAKNAFEPLKFHREYGKSLYYFGRSKKFWTLKYPFVWYNALYLADVLTRFDFLKGEPLVQELIDWIEAAQDKNGRFKPTSMFMCYKGWDFANKKEPSPWITFLCSRILRRWYG